MKVVNDEVEQVAVVVVDARRAAHRAEMEGAEYIGAVLETSIRGVPHRIEAALIPGYSRLDHRGDIPLSALTRVCGRPWSSRSAFKRAAYREMARSLRGGPAIRIDIR